MNSDFKIHTPADDWLPGVLMWRKAHLDVILSESNSTYENSSALSMESIAYLTDTLNTNPNSAGLASAYLNTGWLFYIKDNEHCIDFFQTSMKYAKEFSHRTFLEAKMGKIMANMKFNNLEEKIAITQLNEIQNQINESNFASRSYAFLKGAISPIELINRKKDESQVP